MKLYSRKFGLHTLDIPYNRAIGLPIKVNSTDEWLNGRVVCGTVSINGTCKFVCWIFKMYIWYWEGTQSPDGQSVTWSTGASRNSTSVHGAACQLLRLTDVCVSMLPGEINLFWRPDSLPFWGLSFFKGNETNALTGQHFIFKEYIYR